jgi:uncharacterized protein YjbJ (UPF0337 family)
MNTTNKLNNRAQYWSGKAKETVGRVTGNRRTRYEGKLDQVKAQVKDSFKRWPVQVARGRVPGMGSEIE